MNDVREDAAPFTSPLSDGDQNALRAMVQMILHAQPSVLICETPQGTLRYLFINADRQDAIAMMGRVIEVNARKR